MLGSRPISVDVPHEPGESFEFRRPSWIQEQDAREAAEKKNRQVAKDFGAAFIKEISADDADGDEAADERRIERARRRLEAFAYDLSQFDLGVLLDAGVVGWSYADENGAPVPVTADTIAELDVCTAKWAGQEIVNLMKPPSEDEEKNG